MDIDHNTVDITNESDSSEEEGRSPRSHVVISVSSTDSTSDLDMGSLSGNKTRYLEVSSSLSSDSDFSHSPLRKKRRRAINDKSANERCVMSDSDVNSPMKDPGRAHEVKVMPQLKKKRDVSSDSELVSPRKCLSKRRVMVKDFNSESDFSCDAYEGTKFYNDNEKLPVFQYTRRRYSAKRIAEVLLRGKIPIEKIASARPVCVQDNVTFVVDLDKLRKKEDIRADDLGSWHCNGKRSFRCNMNAETGDVIDIVNNPRRRCFGMYTIIRRYYEHMTARDFKKTIAECIDPDGNEMNLALVQYVFTGPPHPVISKPHGNSKELKPFIRTAPSTIGKLKHLSNTETPKQVINTVTNEIGGVVYSEAVGDLPRNRKQVYNAHSRAIPKDNDALLSVMAMCKEGACNDNDPFVRIVTSAPEPMSVLCTNSQLSDIERFCTRITEFCPLTIDPTFNLGDFSVTITCYRHLLLQGSKGSLKGPVMIGPMLVHRKKEFSSYHFLAATLVSLKPGLSKLCAFGTDGEEALYRAFSIQFTAATHVRCFLHFRDNCKAKLHELNVTLNTVVHDLLQDIFGCVIKGKHGLVDSDNSDEFQLTLQRLKQKWDSIVPGFHDWFVKYKAESMADSMIRPIRVSAGLGDPPEPYYTNEIESINRVVKRKTKYKTCEWPEFCKLALELVKEQENEVEKAVIGIGEYKFKDSFRHLEVPLTKWSSMSVVQRERHLSKVKATELHTQNCTRSVSVCRRLDSMAAPSCSSVISLQGQCFDTKSLSLPSDIIDNMFSKAERLISDGNCIVPAPGTPTAKLVESKSGHRPHFVTKRGSARYCCDTDCPMFKCSQVCSHTIAAAFVDNNLQPFLSKCCAQPNLYAFAKTNTNNSAGKKPSKRKASSKKACRAIAEIQSERLTHSAKTHTGDGIPNDQAITSVCSGAGEISIVQSPTITTHTSQSSVTIVQSPTVNSADQRINIVQSPCVTTTDQPSRSIVQSPPCCQSSHNNATSVQTTTACAPIHVQQSPVVISTPTIKMSSSHAAPPPSIPSPFLPTTNPLAANLLLGLMQQVANSAVPSSVIESDKLFWVLFLSGNISRCQGCSGKIDRGLDGKPYTSTRRFGYTTQGASPFSKSTHWKLPDVS